MNKLEFVPAGPEHVSAIGRICYEAFKEVHEVHGFSPDFPSVDLAQEVLGMLVKREDFYGVVALREGQPVGSNFLLMADPVAGVGPITVDRSCQGQGIGRALMQDVMAYASRNDIERVRLFQDCFNVVSISLYASLGFEVKEVAAYMQAVPAPEADESVRPVSETDLPAIEELSTRIYKSSRRNEVSAAAPHGFAAFLRERHGRVTGYLIPGIFGHGFAETEDDAFALIGEAARRLPLPQARFFCPLSQTNFYRRALKARYRVVKLMSYMVTGPYEPPIGGVWMPSVLC
jgi:ribosomal protein S18 acetylase RimI-like enzyme